MENLPANSASAQSPFRVTLAIPVLNEEKHLPHVLETFLKTPENLVAEILVVDGGSQDGTRERVANLQIHHPRLKLLDNPKRIQAAALNIALQAASEEIFLRADGHSLYADDYVERSVEVLLSTGTCNAGGAQRLVAEVPFQAGVALAAKSFLGGGTALFKNENYRGPAETVYLGCYWTSILKAVGGFAENVLVTEDFELNTRLNQALQNKKLTTPGGRAPSGAVFIDPSIKSWYFPRKSLLALWNQYFTYGRARRRFSRLYPGSLPIRAMLPRLALILALIILPVCLWLGLNPLLYLIGLGIIVLVPFFEVARLFVFTNARHSIWRGVSEPPSPFQWILLGGVALLIMPMAHACGFLWETLSQSANTGMN